MDDLSGQTIKGYALREKIGFGGFGAVYRAHQPIVGREVAIKVILPQFADHPDFIRRFEVEAQLIARLEHPFIVPLYDYWREPGGAYLVMRYLRGGSLRDRLKQGPLSLHETGRLVEQLAGALTVAHRGGVIHRDLTPANILLDPDGNAYLTDFGIAKDIQLADQTDPGLVMGKPGYLSPEQVSGGVITPQADQYALGIVLYEALAGAHPFGELPTMQMLYKHLHEPVPSLRDLRPDLPPGLDAVLQRATAKRPEDRYPDVLTLAGTFRKAQRLTGESASVVEDRTITPASAPIAAVDAEETTPLTLTPPTLGNPYKGLRAFQEADAPDFFGRETLTEWLLARLGEDHPMGRFLAVVGPSGSGKSSVVKAGLLPALRSGKLPGSDKWFIAEMLPGAHPMDELEIALTRVASKQPPNLVEQLHRDNRGLARAAKMILPEDGELLLVVDQFEEVFMLAEDQAWARHFLDLLYATVTEPRCPVRIIITLRADFYDRPLMIPDFSELVSQRTQVVVPLTNTEIERAILGPAERVGLQVEPKLVTAIVGEVGEQPGALPMLQYALTELFERRTDHTLTLTAYEQLGGVLGVLAKRANEVYGRLSAEQQSAARQVFLRLVTLGEGTEDTRRRVKQSELLALGGDQIPGVLEAFGTSRLLTFDRDPGTREPTVEVAHEAIIREWTLLRAWLDESRGDVRLQRMLGTAAGEWQSAGRDRSYLLHGARLAQFEDWSGRTDVALTPDERAFVEASSAERLRQRTRRRRVRNVALIAAIAIAVVMTVLAASALQSRNNERDARKSAEREADVNHSLVLANSALKSYNSGDTVLAISLALEAVNTNDPPAEALRTLQEIAQAAGIRTFFQGHKDTIKAVALSPDGHYALSGSCGEMDVQQNCTSGELILWDVQANSELGRLEGHTNWVNSVVFAPDGQTALSGSSDGTAILWAVPAGDIIRRFEGHTAGVNGVAFSPDGKTFVTASDDTTVLQWDIETGDVLRRYEGHTGAVNCVTFSPDGQTMLSGSDDMTLLLWDTNSGEQLRVFEGQGASVSGAALTPNGQVVSIARNGSLILWDAKTGEQLRHRQFVGTAPDLALVPDGRTALVPEMGQLVMWDIEQWQYVYHLSFYETNKPMIDSVGFSADGRLGVYSAEGGYLVIWNMPSTGEIRRFGDQTTRYTFVAVSPDGRYLLGGTFGGDAVLLDRESGEEIRRFQGHVGWVYKIVFSSDGRYALVASGDFVGSSGKGSIILWDVETGAQLQSFAGFEYLPAFIAFSPDNQLVLGGTVQWGNAWEDTNGGETIVWNTFTGEEVVRLESDWFINRGGFIPGRDQVFTGTGMTELAGVALWDLGSGRKISHFLQDTTVTDVMLVPDSTTLLVGTGGGELVQLDFETGEVQRRFCCHNNFVRYIDLSADQRYVISADNAGGIILWDFTTGEEVRRFVGHRAVVWAVAFSPDGERAYSAGVDGKLIEWQIADRPLEELLAWIHENRYVRDFTCEERALYRIEPLCE